MKRLEKTNLIFHSVLWLVFTLAIALTCIFRFWCNTDEFAQLILHSSMITGILGLLCLLPAILLCIRATAEKVKRKCTGIKLLFPGFFFLISILLWWLDIGLFVTFTGGV